MRDGMIYSLSSPIPIGREGENEAREVAIDICQLVRTWPGLTPQLLAKRPGEADPYPCRTRVEDGVLIWEITDSDTAIPGMGECVIHMVGDGGVIGKSRIARTVIKADISGAMQETPPDAAKPWVDNVLDAGSKTEAAAQRAENAAQNAEGAAAAAAWDVFDANVFIVREQEEDPTYADKTHIEINLAAGDRKVILYVDGQGRPHNYMGRMPSLIDSTVMTQTFGRPVEYTDGRISWQIAQILPDGKIIKRGNAQLKAPNPYKLMISGAVTAQYDGREQVNVNIPTIAGPAGKDGYTPQKGVDYFDGEDGEDGYSPTVALERTEDGVKITAVNKDGEESETVFDGKDGKAADTFVVLDNVGEAPSATPEAIDAAAADGKAIFLEKDGVTYTYAGKVASTLDSSVRVHAFHGAFERRNGRDFLKEVQFKPNGTETIIRFAPILTPNPNKLVLTGAVSATYDGASQVTVEIPSGGTGGGADLDVIEDEEVLDALAENDLMLAVGSGDGVLCDENGNVLEW